MKSLTILVILSAFCSLTLALLHSIENFDGYIVPGTPSKFKICSENQKVINKLSRSEKFEGVFKARESSFWRVMTMRFWKKRNVVECVRESLFNDDKCAKVDCYVPSHLSGSFEFYLRVAKKEKAIVKVGFPPILSWNAAPFTDEQSWTSYLPDVFNKGLTFTIVGMMHMRLMQFTTLKADSSWKSNRNALTVAKRSKITPSKYLPISRQTSVVWVLGEHKKSMGGWSKNSKYEAILQAMPDVVFMSEFSDRDLKAGLPDVLDLSGKNLIQDAIDDIDRIDKVKDGARLETGLVYAYHSPFTNLLRENALKWALLSTTSKILMDVKELDLLTRIRKSRYLKQLRDILVELKSFDLARKAVNWYVGNNIGDLNKPCVVIVDGIHAQAVSEIFDTFHLVQVRNYGYAYENAFTRKKVLQEMSDYSLRE